MRTRIHRAVRQLADCYNTRFRTSNVFVLPRPVAVTWGHISVLQADLMCMEELLRSREPWDYFINTAGTELPLISLDRLHEKLRAAPKGANFLESYPLPEIVKYKTKYYFGLNR